MTRYAVCVDHISSLLPKVLKKRGLQGHATASSVTAAARRWVADTLPDFVADIQPKKFRDGVIVISCRHSIAAQECQQASAELLEYVRSQCPDAGVEQVRLLRDEENTP